MKIGKEISEYVNGKRSGGMANRLERDALSDPFLFEALEGLTGVEGEHSKVLEELDARLKKSHRPKRGILAGWMVAASVVLVGGIALTMLYQKDEVKEDARRAEMIISAAQDSLGGGISLADTEVSVSADSLLVAAAQQREDAVVLRSANRAANAVSGKPADPGEYGAEEDGTSMRVQSMNGIKPDKKIVTEGTGMADGAVEMEERSFARDAVSSRKRLLSGRILDKRGIPVAGAVVRGSKNTEAVTDENGYFQIKVPFHTRELSASSVGMNPKKQAIPENGQVEIVMEQDQAVLAGTVVAGNSRARQDAGSRRIRKRERKNYLTPDEVKRFNEYSQDSLRSPVGREERGEVVLSFRINKQGKAFNVKVEQGIGPECDREAVRLLREYEGFAPVFSISERLRLKVFFFPAGKK